MTRCAYCGGPADNRPVRYEAVCWTCWWEMGAPMRKEKSPPRVLPVGLVLVALGLWVGWSIARPYVAESAPPTAEALCPDQEDAIPVQRMDTGEPFCISPYTLAAYDDSVRAANAGTPKQGD